MSPISGFASEWFGRDCPLHLTWCMRLTLFAQIPPSTELRIHQNRYALFNQTKYQNKTRGGASAQ